jgi:hypoxanthine phosphoribosyltransferase
VEEDVTRKLGRIEIGWEKFAKLSRELALEVVSDSTPDVVVGLVTGGAIVGATLSRMLQRDFFPMKYSRQQDSFSRGRPQLVLGAIDSWVRAKSVLLVDDLSITGETFESALNEIRRHGLKEVKTLCLGRHFDSFQTDYSGVVTDDLILFPWDLHVLNENRQFVTRPGLE